MKLIVKAQSAFSEEQIHRNVAASPHVPPPRGDGCLAIVGGGPSVSDNLDVLRDWGGDIWAINATCKYLRAQGIVSTIMTVDASPEITDYCDGVYEAVFHERVDPTAWDSVKRAYKITGPVPGPTSAVAACYAAIDAGYSKIVIFGCESSFETRHHAYQCSAEDHSHILDNSIWIECGGREYRSKPEYYAQAQQLADVVRRLPQYFSEQSGGLLRALVANSEHDVTHVSPQIAKTLVTLEEQAFAEA